jgi:hypothetical protein
MPRIDGFDVSHWNVMTSPDEVSELSLMSCKATEGRSFVSPTLEKYAAMFDQKQARYQGVYHWIRTDSGVKDQISNLVGALRKISWVDGAGLKVGKLIQLDWERTFKYPKDSPPVLLPDPSVEMIEQWVDGVQQLFGDRVIVYCSDWMPNFVEWRERNPTTPLWYANYNRSDSAVGGPRECEKYNADVWQWSSRTMVPGFQKGIDVNEIRNITTLERITAQLDGPPPETKTVTGAEVDPADIGHDEGDHEVSSHRWMPKGFLNQFEMPGCLPVTPAEVLQRNAGRAPLDPADPFAALPLISEFHQHRFLAILHRNGITAEQIAGGYFIRDASMPLSQPEIDFYVSQGITID